MNTKTEQIAVTVVTSERPTVLTKTYQLNDGVIQQPKTTANMVQGTGITKTFKDINELAEILTGLNTNQAMTWGIVPDKQTDTPFQIFSKTEYEKQGQPQNAVTRTKDFFRWGDFGGVMMLDFDFKDESKALSKEQIIKTLYNVMPSLESAAYMWWCSSSSFIYNGEQQHTGLRGQRVYILVQDAADIERAGNVLFNRLWLKGHGHIEISKVGSFLTRSIIDSSVWQPSRLDFISGANCIAPIEQKRPQPEIHNGAPLDTKAALPDLTAEELAEVKAMQAKAKAELKQEADFIKAEFIVDKALDNLKKQGFTAPNEAQIEHAQNTVRRATDSDTLTGDFVVYLNDGQAVTVGEILDNPSKYHGKGTKDPLEPDYDGWRTVGRLYLFNGQPNLYSQAHGGKSYKLIRQPKEIEHKNGKAFETVQDTLRLLKEMPDYFDMGGQLVTIHNGAVKNITADLLPYYLSSFIQYFTWKPKGKEQQLQKVLIDPPITVIKQILALGDARGLKQLKAVITAPVITPQDHVITRAGYDKETQLYLATNEQPPIIPDKVTGQDVQAAYEKLMQPFSDFPFVNPIDRAVCLSAILTSIIRPVVETAPAFAIDAPKQGTGKTYLAQCIGYLGTGVVPSPMPPIDSKNDEEIRKRLFSELIRGSRNILWDNVMGIFNSASMASFLTASTFTDRTLGKSETIELPNRAMFLVTGNNLQVAGELPRRVLTCRLDRQIENPIEYVFKFNALDHLKRHRAEMVKAGLTIIRGYLQNNPDGFISDKTASFEDWDTLARQPVAWLAQFIDGLDDPKIVINEAVKQDPEQEILGDLLRAIHKEYGSEWFEASQLAAVSTPEYGNGNVQLYEILSEITGGRFNSRSVGKVLAFRRDRIVDGLKLLSFKCSKKHAAKFRVTEI